MASDLLGEEWGKYSLNKLMVGYMVFLKRIWLLLQSVVSESKKKKIKMS